METALRVATWNEGDLDAFQERVLLLTGRQGGRVHGISGPVRVTIEGSSF